MEYLDDGDLNEKIKLQKLKGELFSEYQILEWLTQICQGVKYMHDCPIMHRDLKNQNIFLTKEG